MSDWPGRVGIITVTIGKDSLTTQRLRDLRERHQRANDVGLVNRKRAQRAQRKQILRLCVLCDLLRLNLSSRVLACPKRHSSFRKGHGICEIDINARMTLVWLTA